MAAYEEPFQVRVSGRGATPGSEAARGHPQRNFLGSQRKPRVIV